MGRSQTFQWVSRFKAGRTSIDDDERSGRQVSSSTPEMIERERQIIPEQTSRVISAALKQDKKFISIYANKQFSRYSPTICWPIQLILSTHKRKMRNPT
jgi:hypothetical protein